MNISNTNTCLILTVDGKNCKNNQLLDGEVKFTDYRNYEQESINCIKSWRENAGWLKDIEIYIHSPTEDIEDTTKAIYRCYGVNYIYEPIEDMEQFDYGFMNVHYSGRYFEETLDFEYFIHIDLDMEILKEIPQQYFDNIQTDVAVGAYLPRDYIHQRDVMYTKDKDILINTDFIISKSSSNFYKTYINEAENFNKEIEYLKSSDNFRTYYIEEYIADKIVKENNITMLYDYEQGEGYTEYISTDCTFFWHEHLKSKPNIELIKQKIKVKNEIQK